MVDIALQFQDGAGDLVMDGQDLAVDEGLETAVLVSLFTDARAAGEELPPGHTDNRGWWGDIAAQTDGDEYGSKLWLLAREKSLNSVAVRAEEYARQALQWMLDDGVVSGVEVRAEIQGKDRLGIEIQLRREGGGDLSLRYAYNWQSQTLENPA